MTFAYVHGGMPYPGEMTTWAGMKCIDGAGLLLNRWIAVQAEVYCYWLGAYDEDRG